MAEGLEIDLASVQFGPRPVILLQAQEMRASVFRYATGIEALTITTPLGDAWMAEPDDVHKQNGVSVLSRNYKGALNLLGRYSFP